MALPDPIPTLTVNSVAYDFFRVASGDGFSRYTTANGLDVLTVKHDGARNNRTLVKFDRRKVAADPFDASINQEYEYSVHTVYTTPKLGVSVAEVGYLNDLMVAFLAAGTPDYSVRVIQGES